MRKKLTISEAGSTHLYLILFIIVLAVIGLDVWALQNHKKHAVVVSSMQPSHTSSSSPTTTVPTTVSKGTDNSVLDSNLSSVNSSLNTSNQDANAANAAVGDQQQQVAVPTN